MNQTTSKISPSVIFQQTLPEYVQFAGTVPVAKVFLILLVVPAPQLWTWTIGIYSILCERIGD